MSGYVQILSLDWNVVEILSTFCESPSADLLSPYYRDMRISRPIKFVAPLLLVAMMAPIAAPQIGQIIKLLGVREVVKRFGGDINSALNKMVKRDPKSALMTKVVPVISGGISSRQAVGMVQVCGPRLQVEKVKAVAQLDQDLFGKEIKIRAMIPIDQDTIGKDIKPVDQVGITGIVDLKL